MIDTVGIRADRPFAIVDPFGTPYTPALHVVERYRLIDYEAARQAQQRAEKELFHIPEAQPDPAYRGKGLQGGEGGRTGQNIFQGGVTGQNIFLENKRYIHISAWVATGHNDKKSQSFISGWR